MPENRDSLYWEKTIWPSIWYATSTPVLEQTLGNWVERRMNGKNLELARWAIDTITAELERRRQDGR